MAVIPAWTLPQRVTAQLAGPSHKHRVRAAPDTTSPELGLLQHGDEVVVIAVLVKSGSIWVQLFPADKWHSQEAWSLYQPPTGGPFFTACGVATHIQPTDFRFLRQAKPGQMAYFSPLMTAQARSVNELSYFTAIGPAKVQEPNIIWSSVSQHPETWLLVQHNSDSMWLPVETHRVEGTYQLNAAVTKRHRIRSRPSVEGTEIGVIDTGMPILAHAVAGDWLCISTDNACCAWTLMRGPDGQRFVELIDHARPEEASSEAKVDVTLESVIDTLVTRLQACVTVDEVLFEFEASLRDLEALLIPQTPAPDAVDRLKQACLVKGTALPDWTKLVAPAYGRVLVRINMAATTKSN